MKAVSAVVILCLLSVVAVLAQCKPHVEFTADGSRPTGIYGLTIVSRGDTKKQFVGSVVKVIYDEPTASQITGFTLELDDTTRQLFDLSYVDCFDKIPDKEKGWLPSIIRKGYRLRVDATLTGSAGIVNTNNIIVLSTSGR